MAVGGDLERGINGEGIEEALVKKEVGFCEENDGKSCGSIGMVLLSTAVSVCGSFEFGTCVSFLSLSLSLCDLSLCLCLCVLILKCWFEFCQNKKKKMLIWVIDGWKIWVKFWDEVWNFFSWLWISVSFFLLYVVDLW